MKKVESAIMMDAPMDSAQSLPSLERAREVFERIKPVHFSPYAYQDLVDRLSVIAVVVGLREVAAFGFAEENNRQALETMRTQLAVAGLRTKITRAIRPVRSDIHGPRELLEAFEAQKEVDYRRNNTGRLLWVGLSLPANKIADVVHAKASSGMLLAYPPCCIAADKVGTFRALDQASVDAWLEFSGRNVSEAVRLIKAGKYISLPESAFESNFPASAAKFPFLAHIACTKCLEESESPSARLNRTLRELAETLLPQLRTVIERLGPLLQEREPFRLDAVSKGIDVREYSPLKNLDRQSASLSLELHRDVVGW
ncbi:MAG: hypothetical protein WAQ52_01680 [Terriglobales bacterium]